MRTRRVSFHPFAGLLIVVLVCAAYANSLTAEWHFDDKPNILNNYSVHAVTLSDVLKARHMSGSFARCIGFLSFAFNWYFHGRNVVGYHVGNVLIHALAAVLVYCTVYLTLTLPAFRRVPARTVGCASLFTALLWALSPLQTEAVTYIVQRLTALGALFFMLSLLLFVKGRRCLQGGRRRAGLVFLGAAVPAYALAVLSKENTIMLPFLVLLYEHFFIRPIRTLRDPRLAGAGLVLAGGFLFLLVVRPETFHVIVDLQDRYRRREFTLYERVLTEFRVMVRYLTLIVFPHPARLNLDYNFPVSESLFRPLSTLWSLLFLTALFCAAVFGRRRFPWESFCILWFFINNAVESTVIPLEIIFEHRAYLPSVAITALIVVLLMRTVEPALGRLNVP